MMFLCIDHRNTFSIKRAAFIFLLFSPNAPLYVHLVFRQYFQARGNSCGYCHTYGDAGSNHNVEKGDGVGVSLNWRRSYDIRVWGFIFNSFIRLSAGNNGGEEQSAVLGSPTESVCVIHFSLCYPAFFTFFFAEATCFIGNFISLLC